MTNLEKLMEVFGCKVVKEINSSLSEPLVKVDLDSETAFYKSWCDEEYKVPSDNFDVKTELDVIKHNIDDLCDYLDKRLNIYTERLADLEHNISKCWNRVGKAEQNIREITSELETMNRNINTLIPSREPLSEEDFLKSLHHIKMVRIK